MARKFNMAFIMAAAVVAVAATLLCPVTAQPTAAPTPSPAGSGGAPQTYMVGDAGWIIPTNGAAYYQNWARNKIFNVGDSLVFNFTTGRHNVAKVNKASFDSCSTTAAAITTGPTTIRISTAGEHYYICTVGPHCSLGQKLAINVSGGTASPVPRPSAASTSPPPSVAAKPVSGPDAVPSGQSPAAQPSTVAPSAALAALPITLFSVALLALLH